MDSDFEYEDNNLGGWHQEDDPDYFENEDIDLENIEEMEAEDISEDIPEDMFDKGEGLGDISMEQEWRTFAGDEESKKRSRVGITRAIDIEETLGTEIGGGKLAKIKERIDRQTKTPEDIFKMIVRRTIEKYHLEKSLEDDAIRVMQKIVNKNKKLKFKNPQAIVFALKVFDNEKHINKNLLYKIHDEMAKEEKISLFDLLRYAFFVKEMMNF